MTPVVLALALVAGWVLALVGLCRLRNRRLGRVTTDRVAPQAAGPEVDALDDAGFCSWLGVPAATYERYVDTGVEDLEIFLADRPARRVGEGPAEPAT
jgi:hypothetical protein